MTAKEQREHAVQWQAVSTVPSARHRKRTTKEPVKGVKVIPCTAYDEIIATLLLIPRLSAVVYTPVTVLTPASLQEMRDLSEAEPGQIGKPQLAERRTEETRVREFC